MLETVLSSGMGGNQTYPDSGPGPKTLKHGDENLGYFGTLAATEFFTLAEIRKQADFWSGVDNNPNPTWIKMFLNGKVIYFPTQVLAANLSWNVLYSKGLVYGTNNNGVYPGTPAVNQQVYISKGQENFKLRLFKTEVADPTGSQGSATIATSDVLKAGEWGKVISAICSPRQAGYTGSNWALYPINSHFLPSSAQAVSQNTAAADLSAQIAFTNTVAGRVLKSSASYLWLPVLEFGRDAPVYRPHDPLYGLPVTKAAPALTQDVEFETGIEKYRIISGAPITPASLLVENTNYVDPIYKITSSNIKVQGTPALPIIIESVSYE